MITESRRLDPYSQLMETIPFPPDHLHDGDPSTPGILGAPGFLDRLPRRIRMRFLTPDVRPPLKRIIEYVAGLYGIPVEDIHSPHRQHTSVVVRAQIAWYATEHAGVTLGEVAKELNRDASTLSRMIYRHRLRRPECFSLQFFEALRTTIAPADAADSGAGGPSIASCQVHGHVTILQAREHVRRPDLDRPHPVGTVAKGPATEAPVERKPRLLHLSRRKVDGNGDAGVGPHKGPLKVTVTRPPPRELLSYRRRALRSPHSSRVMTMKLREAHEQDLER